MVDFIKSVADEFADQIRFFLHFCGFFSLFVCVCSVQSASMIKQIIEILFSLANILTELFHILIPRVSIKTNPPIDLPCTIKCPSFMLYEATSVANNWI